jgi:hypothetical protein
MIKRPLVLGALGSMGQRYTAILKHMGLNPILADQNDKMETGFDGAIICTPTDWHTRHIKKLIDYGVPILCEKPVSKDFEEVIDTCSEANRLGIPLEMVNQYKYCQGQMDASEEYSCYDYYQSGKDGLVWDCTSIIALSNTRPKLSNKSPVWKCYINGRKMYRQSMDMAYVDMMDAWLNGELVDCGTDYIVNAHQKVLKYLEGENV